MLYENKILGLMDKAAPLIPRYEINAVDINEALDFGVGNCAVRAYALGCLLKDQFPDPDLLTIKFGYTEAEHGLVAGKRIYGHAALSLWSGDGEQVVIDSDTKSRAFIDGYPLNFPYNWVDLSVGYRQYLDELDRRDVRFSRPDITRVIKHRLGIW